MRIALFGAGAVGGLVAWHLAKAGHDPLLVGRTASVAALRRDGLRLSGAGVDATLKVRASDDAASEGPQDVVMVGLKGQDWAGSLDAMRPLIGPDTLVVPLLNGIPFWYFLGLEDRAVHAVDPAGVLARTIPASAIMGVVLYVAAERLGPSHIVWNGRNTLVVGALDGASTRVAPAASLLRESGLVVEETADIRHAVWTKLVGNASFNPLSVVAEATMGRLVSHPPLRAVMRALMEETRAVARAYGLEVAPDIDARLDILPSMTPFRTSMLQDFDAGRSLELGGIVDAVVELGDAKDVPMPVLRTVGALAAERAALRDGRIAASAARQPSPEA